MSSNMSTANPVDLIPTANPGDLIQESMYVIVSNPGEGIKLKYIEKGGTTYRFDKNGDDKWPVYLTHQHGNTYNVFEHRIYDGTFPGEGLAITIEPDLEGEAMKNIYNEARGSRKRGIREKRGKGKTKKRKRKRKSTKKKRRRKRKRTKKKRRRRRR